MKKKILNSILSTILCVVIVGGNVAMADYRTSAGTSNDNGDGTYLNPVINSDVADPDIICAPSPDGTEAYYMVSTAMQYAPGCPIMKSTDMVNWETVNYLYDTLDANSEKLSLKNGQYAYGNGQWATSIRYDKKTGTFYILTFSYTTGTTQVYTSKDVENGPWKKSEFKCFHDPSIFIDEDGRIYVFYGQNSIRCKELVEEDGFLSIKKEDGDPNDEGHLVIPDMGVYDVPNCIYENAESPKEFIIKGEGTHAYKIDDKYYLLSITWPSGKVWEDKNEYWKRGMVCYRSDNVYGPYEGMLVMNQEARFDGYLGYGGVGQGGITQAIGNDSSSSDSTWYGMIFQDRGAIGRIPHLVTVDWKTSGYEGWPMLKASETGAIPIESGVKSEKKSIVLSDEFNNNEKKNYADVITKTDLSVAVDTTPIFSAKYVSESGSVEIASTPVSYGEWVEVTGEFTAPENLTYGRLELTMNDTATNFYIDDVELLNSNGEPVINNSEMSGNDNAQPWWWGATSYLDNDLGNVENAIAVTSKDIFHDAAPSMYISKRSAANSGAQQYTNGGNTQTPPIVAGETYSFKVYVNAEEPPKTDVGFTAAYVHHDANDVQQRIEIAKADVKVGEWTEITGSFIAPECMTYGRVELSLEKAGVNYYIDDVELMADGVNHLNNGEMAGNDNAQPWWWGATSQWDNEVGGSVDNAIVTTSSNEYHNAAPSMRVSGCQVSGAGAMQYANGDGEKALTPGREYTFRAWAMVEPEPEEPEDTRPGENEPNGSNLSLAWQWNHNPDNRYWSLTDREGWLRLGTTGKVANIQHARNTLTQRTFGPECSGWTKMDVSNMQNGDYAGLAAFAPRYGFVGVKMMEGKKYIVYVTTPNVPETREAMMDVIPNERIIEELTDDIIYLKNEYTFAGNGSGDTVSFYYSNNGDIWTKAGTMSGLEFSMHHFTGYKFALFNFATVARGGYVDFDYFRVDDMRTAEGEGKLTAWEPTITTDGAELVISNTTDTDEKVMVYAASYNGEKLSGVKTTELIIPSGSVEDSFKIDASNGDTIYVWKADQSALIKKLGL